MSAAYIAVVFVHVLAAIVWIGGTLFLALVGAPVLRHVQPAELRIALFDGIGRRFRTVGWWSVIVLLVTGTIILAMRGWLSSEVLLNGDFWRTRAGTALAWKLSLVVLMLVLALWHDLALDPSKGDAPSRRDDGGAARRRAIMTARVGAIAALGVVVAAVTLARS